MKGVAAMLPNSIIDIFRPVRLEERDRKRFTEWRNERVISMLRLGLTVGAAMTILVHFGDRLVDVEIASRLLPYRLLVAVMVLLCGSATYLRFVRNNPDPLIIGLAAFLSVAGAAIPAQLPDYAGYVMVAGQLVIMIFTVLIVHGALTVAAVAVALYVVPLATYPFLDSWPRDLGPAYVMLSCGCAATIFLSYIREQNVKRDFKISMELERGATTDSLTGLPNRSGILEAAEAAHARAQRLDRTFTLCMLDLDHFKQVNDRHGHAIGDTVLKVFAETAAATIRTVDRIGRFGGEEFLLVLGETDAGGAEIIADRLRTAIEAMEITTMRGRVPVTVSVGMATSRDGDEPLEIVIRRADQALYKAKLEGRNRVCAAA